MMNIETKYTNKICGPFYCGMSLIMSISSILKLQLILFQQDLQVFNGIILQFIIIQVIEMLMD